MERKMKRERRRAAFLLKPYTLNSFFFKFNEELISRAKLNLRKRRHNTHFARITQNIYKRIYIYLNREREREGKKREREK